MKTLQEQASEREAKTLEIITAILETDLPRHLQILKIQSELNKHQNKIDDLIVAYRVEMHENSLPF